MMAVTGEARPGSGSTPMFNAGLAYLDRLDTLHRAIHAAFDDNELMTAKIRIRLLQSEIRKRATEEQMKNIEEKMKKISSIRENDLSNEFSRDSFTEGLLDCYDALNDIIKTQKLELQDRAGDGDAVGTGLF